MTVQQVGKPATRKGDPLFMQHLNEAWHKANENTKASLKQCVHLDKSGKVVRIDAIKDFPALETFVRSFADGKTYIGVGAWNGSPGNTNDNNQSRAAQGNTDIQVTYNDGDASPQVPHPSVNHQVEVITHNNIAVASTQEGPGNNITTQEAPRQLIVNHARAAGPGIILGNKSHHEQTYYFYDNFWNGNGTAGANFDHPLTSKTLAPGSTTFVSLPETFKGRVQRGTQLPATWAEFQISASNDGAAHGDISLQQGCDGAATISATDGSGRSNGFSHDILTGAPNAAVVKKPDGTKALATTVGNWMSGPNQAAIDYERKVVGQKRAYITGGTGTDDVASKNKCLAVDFY